MTQLDAQLLAQRVARLRAQLLAQQLAQLMIYFEHRLENIRRLMYRTPGTKTQNFDEEATENPPTFPQLNKTLQ